MILFHHIPKTAGSTFNDILQKIYRKDKVFDINGMNPGESIKKFLTLSQEEQNSFKLIRGHLADKLESYGDTPTRKIIFVRDPIDHFISSFYYIKRASWNKHHKSVQSISTIGDFVAFRTKQNLDNLQMRHISGLTDFLTTNTPSYTVLNDEIFTQAKQILESTEFVLLTEQFDQALMLLHTELNWNKLPFYRVKNHTKNRLKVKDISAEDLNLIKQHNHYDILLYNFAKEHFKNHLQEYDGNKFDIKVKHFKLWNSIRSRFIWC